MEEDTQVIQETTLQEVTQVVILATPLLIWVPTAVMGTLPIPTIAKVTKTTKRIDCSLTEHIYYHGMPSHLLQSISDASSL